jgi:hypothetical protein
MTSRRPALLGVAVLGAMTGSPAHLDTFISRLHAIAVRSAALWLASIVVTA